MKRITTVCALLVSVAMVSYGQGNTFKKIRYNGGTLQTKVRPDDWDNRLTITSDETKLDLEDGQSFRINPKRVTGLSYGQEAHRRVGTMIALGILLAPLALFGLFHKTRLHYVGIEYTTEDEKKGGLLLQAHKDNYRGVLVALKGATGAPIAVAESDRKYVPANVDVTVAADSNEGTKTKGEQQLGQGAATGMVKVASDPSGADVHVDGDFVGNAPATLTLGAGKHTIRVVLDGYKEWSKEIKISGGSDVTLNAVLKK